MKTVWITLMLATVVLVTGFSPIMTTSDAPREMADSEAAVWQDQNIAMINAVRAFVFSWADSWRGKDMNRYLSHYSRSFRAGRLDYKGWRERKVQAFGRSGKVFLEVNDLSVCVEGNRARASFIQHYRDVHYADVGEKTMQLIQQNGIWQIESEDWQPLKR